MYITTNYVQKKNDQATLLLTSNSLSINIKGFKENYFTSVVLECVIIMLSAGISLSKNVLHIF